MEDSISLPHNWKPRHYQRRAWEALRDGVNRVVLVWHRRAGKDAVCMYSASCAAFERAGNYWHMLPEADQCRKAIWEAINPTTGYRRIDEVFPSEVRSGRPRNQEMILGLASGSSWQCVGSDNYNSLVGASPVGIVWSEWSVANPSSWAYLSPILEENGGWALFPFTPRGENHGLSLYESASADPKWFCERLTADDTGVFTQAQLDQALKDLTGVHGAALGTAMFQQEYYCSFSAPVLGAVYAAEMEKCEQEGRVRSDLWDSALPVYTAWDLGHSDATAIWWYQVGMDGVRIIDWYENSQQDLAHYAGVVLGRRCEQTTTGNIQIVPGIMDAKHMHRIRYRYAHHYLPPDARQKTLSASGLSVERQLAAILPGVQICEVPNDSNLDASIQATRASFPRFYFDAERTLEGRRRVRQYHYKYDDRNKTLSGKPVHDWTSHSSTALHVLALSWRPVMDEPVKPARHAAGGWKV